MSSEFIDTKAATEGGRRERQIVAVHSGDEMYGLDIAVIHTIITPQPITKVPRTASHVKGVMNLRGQIIPIIDLRVRLGLPELEASRAKSSRIVIVDTGGVTAGMIVDAVSEVLTLGEDSIQPPSSMVATKDCEYITGIGRISKSDDKSGPKERLIMLMDVHMVLTAQVINAEKAAKQKKVA
ncbi:MAG TPA: chemotaxis protein CheW [Fimbriimonas sp.]|nr:chemotaxis protein CheW [Fimbriimonas sp.]